MADIAVAHDRDDVLLEHTGFRLSWGAIFAGFIAATMVHITLSLVGVAVGFSTWDFGDPGRDLGMGVGIWLVISALIAYYVGGLTTGRLAGVLTRGDGALHGLLMWGVSMLVNLWLLGSGAGMILGGAFGMIERTVAATAGGLAGAVGQAGTAAVSNAGNMDMGAVQAEIESVLRQTGVPELQPENIAGDVQDVRGTATTGASNEALARDIGDLFRQRAGMVDREAIINVIMARSGMTRPEAEQLATRVQNAAGGVQTQVRAGVDQVQSTAEDVAAGASDAIGEAAWWALLALGLSLGAAAWGAATTARE